MSGRRRSVAAIVAGASAASKQISKRVSVGEDTAKLGPVAGVVLPEENAKRKGGARRSCLARRHFGEAAAHHVSNDRVLEPPRLDRRA